MGIAAAILAVALWRYLQPPPALDLRLTQITFDTGVATTPAISPDGRFVAYASDRDSATNLDLYVQQIQGGSPLRLTSTPEDESEPSFSADGATLAFHSEKDGGGIYIVPSTGGEVKLLAAGGRTPRYSPDGRWIAYWTGDDSASAAFVISASGGTPRPVHAEVTAVRAPCWSPDSRSLLFYGRGAGGTADLWVAPLEGGTAEPTGILARTGESHLDDGAWTRQGFLFSTRSGAARNLYRCPLDKHGKAAGAVERLTNGTELLGHPAVSPDGRMAFAGARERFDIWSVPLDPQTGKSSGPPSRLTDSLAPTASPALSADGGTLLYGSSRNGFMQVWRKDLASGRESVAATTPEGASYGIPAPDGSVLFVAPAAGRNDLEIVDGHGGQPRKLASGTRAWDVDPKGDIALISGDGIEALDLRTAQRTSLLRPETASTLSQATFARDGRCILFLEQTPQMARIYAAPFAGVAAIPREHWITLAEGKAIGKPRFSPDGGTVYFISDSSAARIVRAIHFDGKSSADAFDVFNFSTPRLSQFDVNPAALELAISNVNLVTILRDTTSNIWMADLVLR